MSQNWQGSQGPPSTPSISSGPHFFHVLQYSSSSKADSMGLPHHWPSHCSPLSACLPAMPLRKDCSPHSLCSILSQPQQYRGISICTVIASNLLPSQIINQFISSGFFPESIWAKHKENPLDLVSTKMTLHLKSLSEQSI